VAHSRSVQIALDAAKQLEAEGVDCEVGLLATIIINQLSIQEKKNRVEVSIAISTELPEINREFSQHPGLIYSLKALEFEHVNSRS